MADLVVAIGELHNGPWQHLGDAPGRLHVPFAQACMLVDEHLDRLQALTPGLAARASIDAVREILDGTHRSGQHR